MSRRVPSVATCCDRVTDAGVVLFASWTVAYHLCLTLRLGVPWAFGITAVAGLGWLLLVRRATAAPATAAPATGAPATGAASDRATTDAERPLADDPPRRGSPVRRTAALVTYAAAATAAVAMALEAPWTLVWIPWLVAAAAGTLAAWLGLREPPAAPPAARGRSGAWVALAWAVVMAVLAAFTVSPSGDDLFYVNLSQWIATHGEFPIRDTLFADLEYPISNWPPVASYDGLVGAVGWVSGLRAGTVEYLLVPPAAAFVAVLALWRLLRTWQVRYVAVALSVAMVFLLFDADVVRSATPGDLFVTRLWQGKVVLLCIVVPWLLTHLVEYAERPDRRRAMLLCAGGTAAVGLSTTGIFLVPAIALAGAVPLLRAAWRPAVGGFAAAAAYPLGAGVVTKTLGGRSADLFDSRKLFRFDPAYIGHGVFLTGVFAVVMVLAVLLGSRLVPNPKARVTAGVLAGGYGLVLVPGVTELGYDLVGLGPTLHRLSWSLTIAALVAVAVLRLAEALPGPRALAVPATAALAAGVFVVAGSPITTSPPAHWASPSDWKREAPDRYATARILADGPWPGPVLAPDELAVTITVTTTEVKTVAPREYYMDYLRDDPTFHYAERRLLVRFANNPGPWRAGRQAELDRALATVGVAVACVAIEATDRSRALRRAGLRPYLRTRVYRCFRSS